MILAVSKRLHYGRFLMARWLVRRVVGPLHRRLQQVVAESGKAANEQQDIARLRMEVCKRCPLYAAPFCDREQGGCGCYMPAKVQKAEAKCPKGRW